MNDIAIGQAVIFTLGALPLFFGLVTPPEKPQTAISAALGFIVCVFMLALRIFR